MVGQVGKKKDIRRALKAYIMRDREKQKLEDEAEAEKCRKKKEQEEKKLKEENEFKATNDKFAELSKKQAQLQQEKVRVFDHLKKLLSETNKSFLGMDELARLYEIGLAVTCVTTSHQSTYPVNSVPSTSTTVSRSASTVGNQYKAVATVAPTLPVQTQTVTHQKRNRSPSPTVYHTYYKQAAGPIPFQKLEDTHRNHEYSRSYLYPKPATVPQSGTYSAFYSPTQTGAYTIPSSSVHSNTPVYTSYNTNREAVEVLHKAQQQTGPPSIPAPTPSQHSSLFASHRSSIQAGPPSSMQQANHVPYLVDHSKSSQAYAEDKYYMVRSGGHVPIHAGVIPLQQPPQGAKHGSITSGYPVRPVATSIAPQVQLHIQGHGGHHTPQPPHHSSQSSHHTSQPSHHSSQPSHHSSQPSHHSSHSSHHSSSQQSQSHIQQVIPHQSHHQSPIHYQSHHSQSQPVQQPHSSQPGVSVSHASQSHHPGQHMQHQLHGHHPQSHSQSGSHHQLIQHHSSPSIHHSSSQQHMSQSLHHQQALSQQQHQSHQQQLHHHQMQQSHIQQHIISPHQVSQSHSQGQQSQPTSVVTSQTYVNQMNAMQGGSRVVYSQQNVPH